MARRVVPPRGPLSPYGFVLQGYSVRGVARRRPQRPAALTAQSAFARLPARSVSGSFRPVHLLSRRANSGSNTPPIGPSSTNRCPGGVGDNLPAQRHSDQYGRPCRSQYALFARPLRRHSATCSLQYSRPRLSFTSSLLTETISRYFSLRKVGFGGRLRKQFIAITRAVRCYGCGTRADLVPRMTRPSLVSPCAVIDVLGIDDRPQCLGQFGTDSRVRRRRGHAQQRE